MYESSISTWESLVERVKGEPCLLVDFNLYAPIFLKELTAVCSRIHRRICSQSTDDIWEEERLILELFANYALTKIPDWDSFSAQSSEVNKGQIIQLFFQFNSQCVAAYMNNVIR